MEQLSLSVRTFNERVRAMNQTNGKQLVLSTQEARSLQADIFNMLAMIAELSAAKEAAGAVTQIEVDGGRF